MSLDVVLILAILGVMAIALLYLKPHVQSMPDLSAVFIYWPEAYRLAEAGDARALEATVPGISCVRLGSPSMLNGTPGVSYVVLNVTCRWRS